MILRRAAILLTLAGSVVSAADAPPLRVQAAASLRRGVEYFRTAVAVEGTYLWQYSEDLAKREGEGEATPTQGWVQPPGTPAVGIAFLAAFEATGDSYYRDAVRETAYGLVRGQLQSGGWTYSIDFDPQRRRRFAYRDGGKATERNTTTLDDNTTQTALRFLMRADRALEYQDQKIHEACAYALDALLRAQYPNGAWPQGYDKFPDPEKFPALKASYPETWPREWPGSGQYWLRYTFNDNALADTIDMMFEAARVYAGRTNLAERCRAAALKAGNFVLAAQMPDPQPAWAQQYDFDMHPAWARKFEPPAVTGGESQRILRLLLQLFRETGDGKFLEPVPRALEYLRRSRLPNGRLARFYELRTNKPLYFTKDYRLTYDDSDVPTHYSFTISDDTDNIARELERVRQSPKSPLPADSPASESKVKEIIAAQDARGRWVEDGKLRYHGAGDSTSRVIRAATFNRNVETLARYLAAPH